MKLVIIGCGDAGLSAAFAANRQDPEAEITIVSQEDSYYPRCPIPYILNGELSEKDLIREFKDLFSSSGITTIIGKAEKIEDKKIILNGSEIPFDKAIIATGARAKTLPGTLSLRTLKDVNEISKLKKPTIVGGGVLGCELADILGGRLVEKEEDILPGFDPSFSRAVRKTLESKGVLVSTGSSDFHEPAISAIGVAPRTELAKSSGIEYNDYGVSVNDSLETSMKGVYAAGDCISEHCFFTGKKMHSYLGPQADRQGVIAGTNAAGGNLRYGGSINQTVIRIGDKEIGMSGLSLKQAKNSDINAFSVNIISSDLPDYYNSAKTIISMTFADEKLIGLQAMGTKVDGLVNLASSMILSELNIDDMITFPYCFSPPVCNAPHPFIICAEKARNTIKNG